MGKIDLKKLQQNLTPEQIIEICSALGADRYEERNNYIIFPTICHNLDISNASMKLYYYKDDYRFHCYTECSDTFNIYELIKRIFELKCYNEGNFNFSDILNFLKSTINFDYSNDYALDDKKYVSHLGKYKKKQRTIELPKYNHNLINLFEQYYPIEWLQEGITENSMDRYNIRYSISQNKIVIPHYDINGELIGLRGRALNEKEIEYYGKYMPLLIEGKWYAHQLSQNLYGLNISKKYIAKKHIVFIFEAEKSCMLYDGYFNENLSVAVCGSNFNKAQLDILLKNFKINEMVICFDKEYTNAATKEGQIYFKKLWDLCDKYSQYCNMSFLFDRENLLREKDSPIDRGKDIFLNLYNKRVKTWERIK